MIFAAFSALGALSFAASAAAQPGYPPYPQPLPQATAPQQPQPQAYPQYGAPAASPQVQPQPQPQASASCTMNPCASSCACAVRCCKPECCDTSPKVRLSVTGIRGSITHVETSQQESSDIGLSVAGGGDSWLLDGSGHVAASFVLGGGEAGFEGALAGLVELGYRLPIAERHGPFGRAGFDGRLQGNDNYYFSMLELPRLSLGWQYIHDRTVLEAGVRGGPILSGRYNPGAEGYRRLSGSLEWGGFVSAQIDGFHADVSAMRIEARKTGTGTPVDMLRAMICQTVYDKLAICGDGMLIRGDADMGAANGGVQKATTAYVGLTLGLTSW